MKTTRATPYSKGLAAFLIVLFGVGCAAPEVRVTNSIEETAKEQKVKPLSLPPVKRITLENGLTILIVENHQVPYAAFRLLMKAGGLQDPIGKEGLARMATTLLTYGTASRTEDEINRKVDNLGASLGAFAAGSNMQVYGDVTTVNKENLKTFFDLMSDVVLNPVFPEDAVNRMRTRMIGGLAASKDDNSTLAARAFSRTLFEGHPFGRPVGGHPKTLRAITRQDIVEFHQRYFLPEHAILGISGDVNPEEVAAWAEATFGSPQWGEIDEERICVLSKERDSTCEFFNAFGTSEPNKRLTMPVKTNPLKKGLRVIIVDREDPSLNQVQWRMGHQGTLTYSSDAWFDYRLGTQLLGGDFTARLNQVLRVREGLTYGARLNVQHGKTVPGSVVVSTYVKPKDLRRAIELAIGEIDSVQNTPLEEKEVESFKSKLIEALPFRFETPTDTLAEYINLIAGDMDVSFLENYPVGIDAVSTESAQKALNMGIQPDAMLLVVVANASIEEELKPLVDARGGSIEVISVDSLFVE